MTRNLKRYAFFSVIWSLLFFTALNWGTAAAEQRGPYILLAAVVYGVGFALMGGFLGKRDDESKVRYSLGQAYSAVSNLASAAIGGVWIVLFRPEQLWQFALYSAVIAAIFIIGIVNYRRSIKGMSNKDLFR
jgi:predicted MFS family arabinose efflux permease